MSTHTNALLVYGYDLGGPGELKLAEAQASDTNPYGYFKTDWFDEENEDPPEDEDIFDVMTRQLYAAIPGVPPVEHARACEEPVKEHFGVWLEMHAHFEEPAYILAAHREEAFRGYPQPLDLAALNAEAGTGAWDAKLAEALRALGITPTQERPGWLLASLWS